MKKIYFSFTILFLSFALHGQIITEDQFEIKLQKARQVDNESLLQNSQLKIKTDKLIKIMVKVKIKSKGEKRMNLSAFYLLDTQNKIRYRLADYKGYSGVIGYPEYVPFLKTKVVNDKGEEVRHIPKYDTTQIDLFPDYNMNNYQNFEIPINFGSKYNPNSSIIYFGTTVYKKFTAELFFGILTENKDSTYELYYKDEKVSKINLQLRK